MKLFVGFFVTVIVWPMVALAMFLVADQNLTVIGHLGIIVGIVAVLCAVSMIQKCLLRLRFKKAFGANPPRDQVELRILKAVVNAKLQRLALMFEGFCISETEAQSVTPQTIEAYEAQRDNLRQIGKDVRMAKGAFWNAHSLANKMGFGVYPQYTDYLIAGSKEGLPRNIVESEKRLPERR